MKHLRQFLCIIMCLVMIFTTGITAFADTEAVPSGETVLEDGTYTFGVVTNSKMFKITAEFIKTLQL